MNSWETQIRKGVVELAVLASIARGETYGYRIVEHLRGVPGLEFTESTVYPVLTRLARDGSLAIREESSPAGPKRRYYRLTEPGRQRLAALSASWRRTSQSLDNLLLEGVRS